MTNPNSIIGFLDEGKPTTAEANNSLHTGKIQFEAESDTFKRIRESLQMLTMDNREIGRNEVLRELEDIFRAKDIFKGHVYFDDLGDLIQELRKRLNK